MEISQSNSLGDLAALLQMPLQAAQQPLALAGKGAGAKAGEQFSQIMRQLHGAELTRESTGVTAVAAPVQDVKNVNAVASVQRTETNLNLQTEGQSGKDLPLERQTTSETFPTIGTQPEGPLLSETRADLRAPQLITPFEQPRPVPEQIGERRIETTGALGPAKGFEPELGIKGRNTVHTNEQSIPAKSDVQPSLDPKTANTESPAAWRERELNTSQQVVTDPLSKPQSDTEAALKAAFPLEIAKKAGRQEEGPVTVNRAIEGLSALNLERTSSVKPTLEPALPQGYTEKAVADAFTEKVVWMTGQGAQRANLQLHPSELGALQIRVTMIENSAQVEIYAQNADTGEMLETLLPRLQTALEQQGVKVDDLKLNANALFSEAKDERSGNAQTAQDNRSQTGAESGETEASADAVSVTDIDSSGAGRVDYYA